MKILFIPNEKDFKRWVKECQTESPQKIQTTEQNLDALLNRKEIAKFIGVPLVTLTDWMKRGLPYYKQRGRVYFMKPEVVEYYKANKMRVIKFSPMLLNSGS